MCLVKKVKLAAVMDLTDCACDSYMNGASAGTHQLCMKIEQGKELWGFVLCVT